MSKGKPKIEKNPHLGSTFDSFLKEMGIYEEIRVAAIKEIVADRLKDEMIKNRITQVEMAKRMGTSRTVLRRLLDPKNVSVTLITLDKAAAALGKNLEITFKK